jgi:hypothetical protein
VASFVVLRELFLREIPRLVMLIRATDSNFLVVVVVGIVTRIERMKRNGIFRSTKGLPEASRESV